MLLEMQFLAVVDVDRNKIRYFPRLSHLQGLKLVIYDHNPCVNAPVIADGARRVGRWADNSDEEEDEEDEYIAKLPGELTAELEEGQTDEG